MFNAFKNLYNPVNIDESVKAKYYWVSEVFRIPLVMPRKPNDYVLVIKLGYGSEYLWSRVCSILPKLKSMGITVQDFLITESQDSRPYYSAVIFINLGNYLGPLDMLENALRSVLGYELYIYDPAEDGIMNVLIPPPNLMFPVVVGSSSSAERIVISQRITLGMYSVIFKEYGELAPAILYHVGRATGIALYEELSKNYNVRDFDEYINLLKALLTIYGDCFIERVTKVNDSYEVLVRDLIECSTLKSLGLMHGSNLYRGVLAGFFEKVLKSGVKVVETHCITRGSPLCRFVVSPR